MMGWIAQWVFLRDSVGDWTVSGLTVSEGEIQQMCSKKRKGVLGVFLSSFEPLVA